MIHHVSLDVQRDRGEVTVAFWELLGFSRVDPPASIGDRAAFVENGSTQIHLVWVDVEPAPSRGHVAVVVATYEATVDALRAAGHEVEPRAQHWGSPRAYVCDPAGNLVEIMAYAPPA